MNVDLESGNTTNWNFYIGYATGSASLPSLSSTQPLSGRHTITSGTGTDYYGGFPVVCPGAGNYSMMLGNSNIGAEVDQARYVVSVPSGINNYSLIYRYAVVFEDPQHSYYEQPYFRVRAYDQATGAVINCSYFYYVSQSGLPGFQTSPNTYGVYYKNWTTASLNLSGQAGKNVVIEFTAADCSLGGHMGYGYVDMTCGLFAIVNNNCSGNTASPLTAPAGFKNYRWYDANYTTLLDTMRTTTVTSTSTPTVYHVILNPYPGFGCTDTLTTSVVSASLNVNAGNDTGVCNGLSVPLQGTASGNGAPYVYSWQPAAGLSCTGCANPAASPVTSTDYVFTVSDANGCIKSDTVNIRSKVSAATSALFPACGNFGAVSAVGTGGTPPYTYAWNTSPMQFTSSAYNVPAGNCNVSVKDSKNCVGNASVSLVKPPAFSVAIRGVSNVSCYGLSTGSATATVTNGVAPFTYSWNTTPAQNSATANNLAAGTYKVTATDATGCSDIAIAVITQPAAALNAVLTGIPPSCNGFSNGSVAAAASGGTSPYSYKWNTSPAGTSSGIAGISSGSHSLTLKDANGCQFNTSIALTQPSPLSAYMSGVAGASCFGSATGSATVNATGATPPYTYSWNTVPAQTTASAAALASGNYTVTVTDSAGCTATSPVYISQPGLLSLAVSGTDVSCFGGNTGTATATATGGTMPYSYSWNSNPTSAGATAAALPAGNYTATVVDAKGCTAAAGINIQQPAALSLGVAKTDVSCHSGNDGTATAVLSGGTPPYTYSWNTIPAQNGLTAGNLAAGNYTFTMSDSKGCASSAVVSIAQPAPLILALRKTDVSCHGAANGTASVTVNGGTRPYAYNWNTAPAQTDSTALNLASGLPVVTVTDVKGCSAKDSIAISEPLPLSGFISLTHLLCHGVSNGAATATISGGMPPYAYSWNTIPTQTGAVATGLSAGVYTLSLTDSNGCAFSLADTIRQPAKLDAVAEIHHAPCYGAAGWVMLKPSGGTQPYYYSWSANPAGNTPSSGPLPAGVYSATITDSAGCALTLPAVILQPLKLSLKSSVMKQPCKWGAEGALSVLPGGGTAPYRYLWNTTPARTSPSLEKLTAGIYRVTVTDSAGCTDTARISLQALPIHIVADGDQTICRGKSATLHAGGGENYRWWPNVGLNCLACANPVAMPAINTQYFVVGTDSNGCFDTARTLVSVIQREAVGVGQAVDICVNEQANLSAYGGKTYQWMPQDDLDDPASATPRIAPLDATRTYKVAITSNACFSDTLSQTVRVHAAPRIQLGPDFRGIPGASIPLEVKSEGADKISWTPAEGLSCADCFTPTATLNGNVVYVATVRNGWGCTAADTLRISVGCDDAAFYMANTFTPNGDGQNDRFFPQGKGVSNVQRFVIYDRWGETVFNATNMDVNAPDAGWDGMYRGNMLKPDVYLYVIEARCGDGSPVVVRGDVALVR